LRGPVGRRSSSSENCLEGSWEKQGERRQIFRSKHVGGGRRVNQNRGPAFTSGTGGGNGSNKRQGHPPPRRGKGGEAWRGGAREAALCSNGGTPTARKRNTGGRLGPFGRRKRKKSGVKNGLVRAVVTGGLGRDGKLRPSRLIMLRRGGGTALFQGSKKGKHRRGNQRADGLGERGNGTWDRENSGEKKQKKTALPSGRQGWGATEIGLAKRQHRQGGEGCVKGHSEGLRVRGAGGRRAPARAREKGAGPAVKLGEFAPKETKGGGGKERARVPALQPHGEFGGDGWGKWAFQSRSWGWGTAQQAAACRRQRLASKRDTGGG